MYIHILFFSKQLILVYEILITKAKYKLKFKIFYDLYVQKN